MKGDFFSRLAEKTLGVAAVATPDLLPVFVATPESAAIYDAAPVVEETMRRSEHNGSPMSGRRESTNLTAPAPQGTVQSWRPTVDMHSADDEAVDREVETPTPELRSVEFREGRPRADSAERKSEQIRREFNTREKISLADRISSIAPAERSNPPRAVSGPAPAIHISIGRVEVRAVAAPTPAPKTIERKVPPRLSLDQYLRERNEGRR